VRRALWISLFLLLTGLTLGLKLSRRHLEASPDLARLDRDLLHRFAERGFAVRLTSQDYVRAYLVAQKGACRVAVTPLLRSGAEIEAFGQASRWPGTLRFHYDGQWLDRAPRVGVLFHHYAQFYGRMLGIEHSYAPLLAVYASPACDPRAIDPGGVMLHPE
jgi:hypothetical protein